MSTLPPDYENWYREEYPRLVAMISAAFADVEVAKEAADEAILRAYERWDRVSAMISPAGWVYRVAINVARRKLRRRNLEYQLLLRRRVEVAEPPAGEIWQVVAGLSERQRLAVVLRHIGQLREPEIAKAMGISRGGVSSTLRAAYGNLRSELSDPPSSNGMAPNRSAPNHQPSDEPTIREAR